MLFTSLSFLFCFLPITLLVAVRLKGQALLRWIVCSSLCFYALEGQPWFLLPMIATTVLDFVIGLQLERAASAHARRLLLSLSLVGSLGLLCFFKYADFIVQNLSWVLSWTGFPQLAAAAPTFHVLLPAGISFYTFQTLSYILDIYRGHAPAEKNFWKFCGFVTFFPHLVAGPLTRHHQLLPALGHISDDGITPRWKSGVFLFAMGLCKKALLADTLGQVVDLVLAGPNAFNAVTAWGLAIGYGLQIYFDFSAYSDMAIGLARLFNIELPQNFNSPYQALNPSDFWTRWHMTLSQWMRDYIYIPLGGSRAGSLLTLRNLTLTMLLGGLWHGAAWTFAAWGLYHAFLLILHHGLKDDWARLPTALQRAATFLLVSLGWIFFRSTSIQMAADWWKAAFGFNGLGINGLWVGFPLWLWMLCAGGVAIVCFMPSASRFSGYEKLGRNAQIALGLLCALALICINKNSTFLYYRF